MTLALLLTNTTVIALVMVLAWRLGKRRARRDWETTVELVETLTLDGGLPGLLDGVEVFMRAADQPIPDTPAVPPAPVLALRLALILEEVEELFTAAGITKRELGTLVGGWRAEEYTEQILGLIEYDEEFGGSVDLAELIDAYHDITIIARGGALESAGVAATFATANEVTRSNLAKIGPDGKIAKRADGKGIKPEGWTPPDLVGVLASHGYTEAAA